MYKLNRNVLRVSQGLARQDQQLPFHPQVMQPVEGPVVDRLGQVVAQAINHGSALLAEVERRGSKPR